MFSNCVRGVARGSLSGCSWKCTAIVADLSWCFLPLWIKQSGWQRDLSAPSVRECLSVVILCVAGATSGVCARRMRKHIPRTSCAFWLLFFGSRVPHVGKSVELSAFWLRRCVGARRSPRISALPKGEVWAWLMTTLMVERF